MFLILFDVLCILIYEYCKYEDGDYIYKFITNIFKLYFISKWQALTFTGWFVQSS
jgi:hypothetical protein